MRAPFGHRDQSNATTTHGREVHTRVGDPANRSTTMNGLDLAKRDMTIGYGDRTFALRAYREEWGVARPHH